MTVEMSLQEASEARKARLLAFRTRKEQGGAGINGLLHRNFDPETRTLRKHKETDEATDTLEENTKGMAEMIKEGDEQIRKQDLDIFNIAPKRPNWDLKREMEEKLKRLERKNQEAIYALIRQRLASSQDLVGAMNAAREQEDEDEDSD